MKGRVFRVLYGIGGGGPSCLLMHRENGFRCYCNSSNPVLLRYVKDVPQDTVLSCQVCEAYRQRMVAFWQRQEERESGPGREAT